MDFGTLAIIAITVIIHLIGIGLFLLWFAAGRPMSRAGFEAWWKKVHLLPAWVKGRNKGTP